MHQETMSINGLAPGTRFFPTEDELLEFYLPNRLLPHSARSADIELVIPLVDLYNCDAPQLPAMSGVANRHDPEQWFFFCARQEREAQGGRPARTTPSGYWKATGSPSYVYSRTSNRIIGLKKTLVFYRGRAPCGRKTIWKMNEYKAIDDHADTSAGQTTPQFRNELSLCRVYIKTGTLPRSFDRRPPSVTGGDGARGASRRPADAVPSSTSSSHAGVQLQTTASSDMSYGDDGGLQLHGAAAAGVDGAIDLDDFQNQDWDLWAETDADGIN